MSDPKLISKIPDGPLKDKWSKRKAEIRIVSPNNKRKLLSCEGHREAVPRGDRGRDGIQRQDFLHQ